MMRAPPRTPAEPRRSGNPNEHPQWLYHQHKGLHPEQHPEPNITSGGQGRGISTGFNQDDLLVTNIKTIPPPAAESRKQAAFTGDGLDNSTKAPPIPWAPQTTPYTLNLR